MRTVASDLITPISMAFIGDDDFLLLEKNTGQVKHFVDGEFEGVALDLAVNFQSERGLLGIALHPDFPEDPGVYLFWTCRSTTPLDEDEFTPEEEECPDPPVPADDTEVIELVPLRGNRVDRFTWNPETSTLTFDHNLIKLRAFQADGADEPAGQGDSEQVARANHDGGILRFGPDGKLYVFYGDQGRRGALQNLECGPVATCPDVEDDDQFGGPEPDDDHMSGVILRLEDDGSTPTDNPFFAAGAAIPGEAGANIQKIFAYGLRNSFGMAFDPESGNLWEQENGDDSFTELNLVEAGMNGGWVQIMGPVSRLAEFKAIETDPGIDPTTNTPYFGLQQLRWPPTNIADTPSRGAGASLHAARRPLQRSRVQLEVRGLPGRHRVPRQPRAGAAVRRRSLPGLGQDLSPQRSALPVEPDRQSPQDRGGHA